MKRKWFFNLIIILALLVTQFSTLGIDIQKVQATPAALSAMTCTPLTTLSTSANTGEKPQSKVWTYAGEWWAVLPSSTPTSGTWLWKLDGIAWSPQLKLSDETGTQADVKSTGNVAHILLYDSDPTLVSVEYSGVTYIPWTTRPVSSSIALPDSEIATIDIDSNGRMWLATESGTNVVVHYSDSPYSTWYGPVTLATGIGPDDIAVVTALPNDTIGVLWSNQMTDRFGFRVHTDGADPTTWSTDEVPASSSALGIGFGMADDHLNVAVASDGTLYAAVKTSYDTSGYTKIALLVRRPAGTWDALYDVDESGTRGILVLNELSQVANVVYTSSEGNNNIVFKESPTSTVSFGSRQSLISGASNNVSSTKQNYTDELVVISSSGSNVYGVFCSISGSKDSTLVAHYEMEENGGGTLIDSTSNDNDATISGTPLWVPGITGLGLELDGTTDSAIALDDPSLDIANQITLAAWIKPEIYATQDLIKKAIINNTDGYELSLSTTKSGTDPTEERVFFRINQSNGNLYRVDSVSKYPIDGTWIHAAATFDGTNLKIYIDGVLDGTTPAVGQTIAVNGLDLGIGNEPGSTRRFQGQMDDVRVYNRALSPSEIKALAGEAGDIADLSITKNDGLTTADPGDSVTYTIAVTNGGPDAVIGATVADTFTTDVTGATWSCITAGGASCGAGGSGNFSDSVDLPVSSTVTYTINANFTAEASGVVSNTATVTVPSGVTDPVAANNSATDNTTVGEVNSLIAHYEMEDGSPSTTLADSSGYGYTANIISTPTWPTGACGTGLALGLDGSNDYALTTDNDDLDITTNRITLAAWIKPGITGTQRIIRKVDVANGYSLFLSANHFVSVRFNGSNTYRVDSNTFYDDLDHLNEWIHIAATYDGTTINLYIDGTSENPKTTSFTIGTANNDNVGIGASSTGADKFQGALDDVQIYDYVLTGSEIEALAECPVVPEADLSITKDDGQTSITPGATVEYEIVASNNGPEAVTGATVTDTFPSELTGVVSWTCLAAGGASCTSSGSGNINQTVDLPNGGSVTYTVSATFDSGATNALENTATVSVPSGVLDPDTGNNSATDIDVLTSWATRCGSDTNLRGCWQMDENAGTNIYDSSTIGNSGVLSGDAGWVTSRTGMGHALNLDGTGDYALVPDDASLDITSNITLAAWVKPGKLGTQYLVKKATMNGIGGYELSLSDPGKAFVRFNQIPSGNTYRLDSLTSYPTTGNIWMHLAATYDGSYIRIYVNGVQDNISILISGLSIATNSLDLGIGADSIGGTPFQGQMDDVRVYNRALSLEDIQDLVGAPTNVIVSSFNAESRGSAVRVNWETATEVDLIGFNLYRSETIGGSQVRLNQNLIPAISPGSLAGNSYLYFDPTAEPGKTYDYWLEIVSLSGKTELEPMTVIVNHIIFVPMLIR